MVTELFKKDPSSGRIRVFRIEYQEGTDAFPPGIRYQDGLLGGKLKDFTFKEAKPKNIGKTNETTADQQAQLMLQQEVNRKLNEGYFYNEDEAKADIRFTPMLCPSGMKWVEWKHKAKFPLFVSPKLDGFRCYIKKQGDRIVAFSRTNKEWFSIPHILEQLYDFFEAYPDVILDGELYNHKFCDDFQELSSILSKSKPTIADLKRSENDIKYCIYDIYVIPKPEAIFEKRFNFLNSLKEGLLNQKNIAIVQSIMVNSHEEYDLLHTELLDKKFEGSIVRTNNKYQPNKRSPFLLKRKEVYDLEVIVLDIYAGEGANVDVASAMLIQLKDGTIQKAGMGKALKHDYLQKILQNKNMKINKKATVQYFGKTKDGKLRFPKFIRFREID